MLVGLFLIAGGLYYFTDIKDSIKSPGELLSALTSKKESEKQLKSPDLGDSSKTTQKKPSVASRQPVSTTATEQQARISSKFIQSKPSNAEIYINGQSISKYTPVLLDWEWDNVESITLKKTGYSTKKVFISPEQSQHSISVVLSRSPNRQGFRPNVEIINVD